MAERVRPISPQEVVDKKRKLFPDAVIESFNELIAKNDRNGRSVVDQDEVVQLMISKGLRKAEIYDKGWLDVEDVYRKARWDVEYDKPGYNESYSPHFIFSKLRQRARY